MYFDDSLLDGEEVIIDFTEGNKFVKSSKFGSAWQSILRDSDIVGFYLLPGTNYISIFVFEAGSPTVTAYMQWRNTHWSADGVAA